MKTLNFWATALFCLLFVSLGHTQNTIQDSHKKLTEYHSLLNKKHEELNSGTVKDFKNHTESIGVLLESTKKQHIALEKKHTPKEKEGVKANHDAIRKNYASAMAHYNAMKEEAAKAKPDQLKIKGSSKLMNSQIKEAEKQNLEIMKKGIK